MPPITTSTDSARPRAGAWPSWGVHIREGEEYRRDTWTQVGREARWAARVAGAVWLCCPGCGSKRATTRRTEVRTVASRWVRAGDRWPRRLGWGVGSVRACGTT